MLVNMTRQDGERRMAAVDNGESLQGNERSVLERTLVRIESLYDKVQLQPGLLTRIGLKPGWTVVTGDGDECGTAFRFTGPHRVFEGDTVSPKELSAYVGKSLMNVARTNISSPLIPLRSVAVACLSALSQPFIEEKSLRARGFKVVEDRDVLKSEIRPEDVVTLIGYGGMLQNLLGRCKELHVCDMRPPESLLTTIVSGTIEYAPSQVILHGAEDDASAIAHSDIVIITASTLVNGTLDELLRYAANARLVLLYGPSASMIPDVLLESGVDFVMSHYVSNPECFLWALLNDMNMESALRKDQQYQTMTLGTGRRPFLSVVNSNPSEGEE
jgi:uncharacterized protein